MILSYLHLFSNDITLCLSCLGLCDSRHASELSTNLLYAMYNMLFSLHDNSILCKQEKHVMHVQISVETTLNREIVRFDAEFLKLHVVAYA